MTISKAIAAVEPQSASRHNFRMVKAGFAAYLGAGAAFLPASFAGPLAAAFTVCDCNSIRLLPPFS
jgi:hypothetical protein